MEEIGLLALVLLFANAIVTYKGFKDLAFFKKYCFDVEAILFHKEYERIISSGFLHVDWTHFLFNMFSLYVFSGAIEFNFGIITFLLIYFGSLIVGNLFSLYIHRNHPDYTAVGASGAVSGIVFASIAFFPNMEIGLLFLPMYFPSWLFGIAYVAYTIYGIKSQKDNIGHEAHLGGGIFGLIVAVILSPKAFTENPIPVLAILLPSIIFIYYVISRPHVLLVDKPFEKPKGMQTLDDKYNAIIVDKQIEVDKLLDKINKLGYDKLSKKEQERLKELTK